MESRMEYLRGTSVNQATRDTVLTEGAFTPRLAKPQADPQPVTGPVELPNPLLADPLQSAVWLALARRSQWSHGFRLGRCRVPMTVIASESGVSVPSVRRALSALSEAGLVLITRVVSGGRRMGTVYSLFPSGLGDAAQRLAA